MKRSVIRQTGRPRFLRPATVFTTVPVLATTTLLLAAAPAASAQLDIPLTYIDKAGNANDTTGFGAVDYNYYIGTSEVTNGATASASTETGIYTLAGGGVGMMRNADVWAAGGYPVPPRGRGLIDPLINSF